MQLLILLPAFLLFLYVIYKLVKDDYVFIRKNISLEQMFDVVFVSSWVGLFFARVFYFIFHFGKVNNVVFDFFSPEIGGLSFFGAFLGGLLTLYLFGKYKKMPLERLFDFFTLAFVICLPVGFIAFAFLAKDIAVLYLLGNAFVYAIFALFSLKYVYPKLSSRELKEGNLFVVFLVFFAVVLLLNSILLTKGGIIVLISIQSIVFFLFLLFSFVLFFLQGRGGFINRKR